MGRMARQVRFGVRPRLREEAGVAAVEYGILIAAAALVMIGGMVAVGAASDAVFDDQAASASSPASSVIGGNGTPTSSLDDLTAEMIEVDGITVDSSGNRWTASFQINSDLPLPDGTVIPVSGDWEALDDDGEVLFTEPVASCVVVEDACVISRTFARNQGGSNSLDEPIAESVRYVDLVVNGFDFGSSDPVSQP